MVNKFKTRVLSVVSFLSLIMSLTGCGASSYSKSAMYDNSDGLKGGDILGFSSIASNEVDFDSMNLGVNTEEYEHTDENNFLKVSEHPLSTFSADVDTASYTNIRRLLTDEMDVPTDAVRIEEILNYFDYDYITPEGEEPFAVTTELSDCPWSDNQLLMIGIKAREDYHKDEHIPKNLVFLVDVSGSMYSDDKLPLVQKAFKMLTKELNGYDYISIVTYADGDRVVLDGESGDNVDKIVKAIDSLEAGGSTAGERGIQKAYEIAEKHFIPNGNNRIILATDGDLNVGISSPEELKVLVEEKRKTGICLSVLGFGTGNLKDNNMEALADFGNGNYSYIDCVSEAKKVLVDEMDSTLTTVAKDVKFQVEFNPDNISEYRLIGYENRALEDKDFEDDKKDAGEVGAGDTVTVLYEIKRIEVPEGVTQPEDLMTINVRCKKPNEDESKLYTYTINSDLYTDKLPKNLNFAACCAEFGMLLKGSEYKGTASYAQIDELFSNYDYSDDEYKTEFLNLVHIAKNK